jgi:hypothetical protein
MILSGNGLHGALGNMVAKHEYTEHIVMTLMHSKNTISNDIAANIVVYILKSCNSVTNSSRKSLKSHESNS